MSLFRCNQCGVVTDHQPVMKHCLNYLDNWYKSCDPVTSILTTGNSTIIRIMELQISMVKYFHNCKNVVIKIYLHAPLSAGPDNSKQIMVTILGQYLIGEVFMDLVLS